MVVWALPLLASSKSAPSICCGIDSDVTIIRISLSLSVRNSNPLLRPRVDDNPLVGTALRTDDDEWLLPAQLVNPDLRRLHRATVRWKENVCGLTLSPVVQVISASDRFPAEEVHIARAK